MQEVSGSIPLSSTKFSSAELPTIYRDEATRHFRGLTDTLRAGSVANLTRQDAAEFFPAARQAAVRTTTHAYPLRQANEAIEDLRMGRLNGAAVLIP